MSERERERERDRVIRCFKLTNFVFPIHLYFPNYIPQTITLNGCSSSSTIAGSQDNSRLAGKSPGASVGLSPPMTASDANSRANASDVRFVSRLGVCHEAHSDTNSFEQAKANEQARYRHTPETQQSVC